MASPGTTPRLVQFMHHPMSQGCAQGHKEGLRVDGGTSVNALQKSCNEMRGEIQEGGKERRKDQERQRKKWGENRLICTCKHCVQWVITHQLMESNRSLKIETKMNQ